MNKGADRNKKNWDDNMGEDEDLKQNCGKQGLDTHPCFQMLIIERIPLYPVFSEPAS